MIQYSFSSGNFQLMHNYVRVNVLFEFALIKNKGEKNMGYSIVLSGQGSEKIAMLKDVVSESSYARELIQEASELVKIDLFKVIESKNILDITDPRVNQILIFLFHNIYSKLTIEKIGSKPDFVMGHSLGQLCSYSVSNVVSTSDMLGFLKKRTDIINDDSIELKASFVNCFGISYESAKALIEENMLQEDVAIGLHNQELNNVLAVTPKGKEEIAKLSKIHKFIVQDLAVARPYHTFFMQEYNEKLLPIIESLAFHDTDIPVLLNNSCRIESLGEKIKEETRIQMVEPVFWYESLKQAHCENYVVLDPMKSQCKILGKNVDGNILSVSNYMSLKALKI